MNGKEVDGSLIKHTLSRTVHDGLKRETGRPIRRELQ